MGTPVQLLSCSEDGRFEMGAEAVAQLRKLKGPVGVVAVCGRARQGKSFLLNQLLGRSSGFQVAPTQRPCTKGLWLWSEPIPRVAPDGTHFNLVLVDTEGIDAYDQTGTYSTQIFSLAMLCSSLFIYNQMGGIDEAALERLQLIVEMTKHIRVRAGSGGSGKRAARELASYTPTFFWLLRDFYLDLADEGGREMTPLDYLEQALAPVAGSSAAVQNKNLIRESIRDLFPDRDCFALVRPADDEHILRNLDSVALDNLRPQFLQGLAHLTESVFAAVSPKSVGSAQMTGPALASLLESFVDAINNGAVPTISTAWQNVVEVECARAADVACAAYDHALNVDTLPLDDEAFQLLHNQALAAAEAAFEEAALGEGPAREAHRRRFEARVGQKLDNLRATRAAQAEARCAEALQAADTRLLRLRHSDHARTDQVMAEVEGIIAAMADDPAAGAGRHRKVVEFLAQRLPDLVCHVSAREAGAAAAGAREQCEARYQAAVEETRAEAAAAVEAARAEAGRQAAEAEAAAEARAEAAEARRLHDVAAAEARAQQQVQQAALEQAAALEAAEAAAHHRASLAEQQAREAVAAAERRAMEAEEAAEQRGLERGRREAEDKAAGEWTSVITAAEQSATKAAEEAYLGMLCDFIDRIDPAQHAGCLPAPGADSATPAAALPALGDITNAFPGSPPPPLDLKPGAGRAAGELPTALNPMAMAMEARPGSPGGSEVSLRSASMREAPRPRPLEADP